eukprot:2867872-Prymnesium_polylepis.1
MVLIALIALMVLIALIALMVLIALVALVALIALIALIAFIARRAPLAGGQRAGRGARPHAAAAARGEQPAEPRAWRPAGTRGRGAAAGDAANGGCRAARRPQGAARRASLD